MPRYYPNNRFSDCYSSVGNITFYHRNGECFYKTKPNPIFPGTTGQQGQLSLHRKAIAAWRTLTHETQLQWNSLAKGVLSKRPPFNNSTHISGYNLFVSAYHGLATIGNERIPLPKPVPQFPEIYLEYRSAEVSSNGSLEIIFIITPEGKQLQDYFLLGKLQLTKPGHRPNTGLYRNYKADLLSIEGCKIAKFTINEITNLDFDVDSCSLHIKYCLIDANTGYRTIDKYLTEVLGLSRAL